MRLIGAVLTVACISCGDDGGAVRPDASADAAVDAPTRTVKVTMIVRQVGDAGVTPVPADLSTQTFEVLELPSFTKHSAMGKSDGTAEIPGVPPGPYLLHLNSLYFDLTADTVDLSYDAPGRATMVVPTSPTTLTMNITGLAAWQTTDQLQIVSTNAGLIDTRMATSTGATNAPTAAASALSGMTFNLQAASQPAVVDSTLGDHVIITQLATESGGSAPVHQVVSRSFEPASLVIANGGTATVSGAFATPSLTPIDVTWDLPTIDMILRRDTPATGPYIRPILELAAYPSVDMYGLYSSAPDLAQYAPGYDLNIINIATATWAIRDPYPASWTRLAAAEVWDYRYETVPGTSAQIPLYTRSNTLMALGAVAGPVELVVGPVIAPMINGASAYGSIQPVGDMPTISWSAPMTGTANGYSVYVYKIRVTGATAAPSLTAGVFLTTKTSLQLPPGLLQAGSQYAIAIEALAQPSVDLLATPYKLALPTGDTMTMTSVFSR
jgi:hypothetical protein